MNQSTYGAFRNPILLFSVVSFFFVICFAVPHGASAATVLTENFGTGSDQSDIPIWEEHENGTIGREGQGSGEDIASPDGGRFGKIAEDSNDNGNEDGWICREVNAQNYTALTLTYYWNGDDDASSSEKGIVEARNNGNGDANCGANGGWTQLQSHGLTEDTPTWNTQAAFSIAAFDNTKFLIRFRNSANSDDEYFRVDGIKIEGEQAPGRVVVKKILINDNGGNKTLSEFSFTISGGTPALLPATLEGATSTLPAGSTYTVLENEEYPPYLTTYSPDCSGSVYSGEIKYCVVTNNDIEQQQEEEQQEEEEPNPEPQPDQCKVTQTIVSDTLTIDDAGPATILTFIHSVWTALISDASWIWSEEPLANPTNEVTENFIRDFTVAGVPMGGVLTVAADNSYSVILNGEPLCSDATENNFGSVDTCIVDAGDLVQGENTIEFIVTNWAQEGGTQESNPAGLLYKLVIEENKCSTTFSATKIVCPSESDLPNYGVGGDTTVSPSLFPITATTASEFLENNPQCHIEPGWSWQWAPQSELQPPMDFIGPAPLPWKTFTDTDNDGVTTFTVSPVETGGAMIWVREVMQPGYVPFGGDDPFASYSSEMHCGDTSQHFDNRDGNGLGGGTVHCVAWNAELPQCVPGVELLTNGGFENPVVTNTALWNIFPSGTPGLGWVVGWFGGSGSFNEQTRPVVANAEIQENGLLGWLASAGTQWSELDSDWGGPDAPGSGEPGAVMISQTIGTVVGESYTFSFDFSPRPGTDAAQNNVEVLANGLVIGSVGPQAASGNQTEWTTHSFTFVATTSPTTFALRDAGSPNDSVGTFIDDASLMCNPKNDYPPTTITASKIVCASEGDLPNYGVGGDGEGSQPVTNFPITETTAADFLESHPNCWLEPGWSWQWASMSEPALPVDLVGPAPSPWATITDDDNDGVTEFTLDPDVIGVGSVWIREVFQAGYVPFGGDNPTASYSSEMHCGDTSQHFDNRDGNGLTGAPLYCVAWNALQCDEGEVASVEEQACVPVDDEPEPEDTVSLLTIVKSTEGGDGTFSFSIDALGELEFSDDVSTSTVEGSGSLTLELPGVGTYWVTEDTVLGWTFEDALCYYGNQSEGVEIANGEQITVNEAGDDVICYFYNSKNNTEVDETPENDFTPPADLCNNIDGVQSTVPAGHTEANNVCVPVVPNNGGGGGGGGSITNLFAANGQVAGASTQQGQVLGETCGLYMDQYLRRGNPKNSQDQVTRLQQFLVKHGFASFVPSGFFGPLTEKAVKAFQAQYAASILTPWGITSPTGLAYLTTLRQINLIECPALSLDLPQLIDWSSNAQVR